MKAQTFSLKVAVLPEKLIAAPEIRRTVRKTNRAA
jgi:hypothetical protein